MPRHARVVRLVVAAAVVATSVSPAVATAATRFDDRGEVWRPWTRLLDADPFRLPTEVGALQGVRPTSRCRDLTTDLSVAVSRFGTAIGRSDVVRAPHVRYDSVASAHLARLVDCLAAHTTHLTPWDGERLGPAPDALRAQWLGATQDLLRLAAELPRLDLPTRLACVDAPLCLIQTGGPGSDLYTTDAALIVDSGGADEYRNNAGGGHLLPAAAVVLDRGVADDDYVPTATDLYGLPTIGAGYLGGVGIVVDEGGNDLYRAVGGTMGAGFAGAGTLLDLGVGSDVYDSPWAAGIEYGQSHKVDHGAGVYGGFGLLYDAGGDDSYVNAGVDSIGWGAAGGTGLLVDVAGTDHYLNTPGDTGDVTGGCCVEVSGVSIGTGEVGGVGAVLDGGGWDTYECTGTLTYGCQGTSYFGELGLVYDRGGNDIHRVPPFGAFLAPGGIGSGGLGGLGVHADDGGDDDYFGGGQSAGYGSGGVGVFVDRGGDDDYVGFPTPTAGGRNDGTAWSDGVTGVGLDV